MTDEFDENPEVRFSNKTRNFMKPKFLFFTVALGAVFILVLAVGSVRSAAGNFLASIFNVTQRTFSPNQVFVGEIPVNSSDEPANSPSPKISASPIYRTGGTSANPPKTTQSDSKDKLISEMNDKINELQAKLNAVSAVAQNTTQSISSASASTIIVPPPQPQTQTNPQQNPASNPNPTGEGRILISEIMAGADGNSNYEFIELYNAGSAPVDLTGWSVKKKSSTGSESSLVAASRLSGKVIQPGRYFLLGNENGYQGSAALDVPWPSSYTLAYANNSVILYNGGGAKVEEIFWSEIPKSQSFVRTGWSGSQFTLTSSPTPQNSQGF